MVYSNEPVNTASLPGILVLSGKYYQLNSSMNTIPAANAGETLQQLVTDGVYVRSLVPIKSPTARPSSAPFGQAHRHGHGQPHHQRLRHLHDGLHLRPDGDTL
ncbi:MAG: hypothetical protein WDM96_17305 [Lacunisphaera sp.]